MTIAFTKYVNIISGVGGGAAVAARELIGRLFTNNLLVPTGSVIEFSTLTDVGTYFGTTSEEYLRASFYFGWISKKITSPQKISFARWTDVAQAPMIFGGPAGTLAALQAVTNGSFGISMGGVALSVEDLNFSGVATAPTITGATPVSLATLQAISNGTFNLTIGGVTLNATGVNLTTTTSFVDVATALQTVIRTGTGAVFTAATVTYSGGVFNFLGGATGAAVISVAAAGSGTDLSTPIGWAPEGSGLATPPIWTNGSAGVASYTAIAAVIQAAIRLGSGVQFTATTVTYDNSTGGFNLVGGSAVDAVIAITAGTQGTDVSQLIGWLPQVTPGLTGAIWSNGNAVETITDTLANSASLTNNFGSFLFTTTCALVLADYVEAATWNNTQNLLYQFMVPASAANVSSYATALANFSGTGVTATNSDFAEMEGMTILAATNYNSQNATQNYMFNQFALTPSVTDTPTSNAYDLLNVNYYGLTQNAGQPIAFFQRGVLMGTSTSPSDMSVYANEQWLKDAAGVAIMTLLLALAEVSANVQGKNQIINTLQGVIDQALFNGVISVGKTFTNVQQLFITQITGDPNAWIQVQNIGYWLTCAIIPQVGLSGNTEYVGTYTLVYGKNDVVRSVSGTHVLI